MWICYCLHHRHGDDGGVYLAGPPQPGIPAMVGRENSGRAPTRCSVSRGGSCVSAVGSAAAGGFCGQQVRSPDCVRSRLRQPCCWPASWFCPSSSKISAAHGKRTPQPASGSVRGRGRPRIPLQSEETADDVTFWAAVSHLRQNPHLALVVLSKSVLGSGWRHDSAALGVSSRGYSILGPRTTPWVCCIPCVASAPCWGPCWPWCWCAIAPSAIWHGQAIGTNLFLCGLTYVLFSESPTLKLAALFVLLANMATGAVWVVSTTMMQLAVPNAMMGRLSAIRPWEAPP